MKKKICNKIRYVSEQDAKEHLAKIKRYKKYDDHKIPCRYYWCCNCDGWHLSSYVPDEKNFRDAPLKHPDKWDALLLQNLRKENPFYIDNYLEQLEKRRKVILSNIETECKLQSMLFDKKIKLLRKKYKHENTKQG